MEGYGLYWYCLELIAQNVDKSNLTFELEHDAEIIAHDTGIHIERVQEMMTAMIGIGLFENNSGAVTCLKMAMRLDETTSKNIQIKHLQEQIRTNSRQIPDSLPIQSGKSPTRIEQKRTDKNMVDFIDPAFMKFWTTYPKRNGPNPRKPALQRFASAVKAGADPQVIISAAAAYSASVADMTDRRFVAQAVTWLNQERWKDQAKPVNREHLGAK